MEPYPEKLDPKSFLGEKLNDTYSETEQIYVKHLGHLHQLYDDAKASKEGDAEAKASDLKRQISEWQSHMLEFQRHKRPADAAQNITTAQSAVKEDAPRDLESALTNYRRPKKEKPTDDGGE